MLLVDLLFLSTINTDIMLCNNGATLHQQQLTSIFAVAFFVACCLFVVPIKIF